MRTLVVWCPDWPVVSALAEAGREVFAAAAVFVANRVVSCTERARREGVRIGQRRREAQSRCPELLVLRADPERDARLFEPVVSRVEELAPGVEILRPGLVACPMRGPARYFGSEEKAAEHLQDAVESLGYECRIGAADVLPVAVLAARRQTMVPIGGSAAFCAALPMVELARESAIAPPERAQLVDLLARLGIRTAAEFAALPESTVATRFGADGAVTHRLARGLAERGLSRRSIPADLSLERVCDPPLDRVDTAAFLGRALAEEFHQRLAAADLACTRLRIHATTESGEELSRTWRCATPLTPAATADRLRWQLDGWLTGRRISGGEDSGPGAITRLVLEPVEAVPAGRIQFGLWGSAGEDDERAHWALARVQGLLGPDSVVSPVPAGGRAGRERITLLPWGQEREAEREPDAPWPGHLPAPSPTAFPGTRSSGAVSLVDPTGQPITIDDRGTPSADPAYLEFPGGRRHRVTGWAGPWLYDERWWRSAAAVVTQPSDQGGPNVRTEVAPSGVLFAVPQRGATPQRGARPQLAATAAAPAPPAPTGLAPCRPTATVQLLIEDGPALVVGYAAGRWSLDGMYD